MGLVKSAILSCDVFRMNMYTESRLNLLIPSLVAQADNGPPLLPLECPYLNRTAFHTLVGQQPALPKHFTLKRKPKSAALRAELTQKGNIKLATNPFTSSRYRDANTYAFLLHIFRPPAFYRNLPHYSPLRVL